jgi:hypothetical protein
MTVQGGNNNTMTFILMIMFPPMIRKPASCLMYWTVTPTGLTASNGLAAKKFQISYESTHSLLLQRTDHESFSDEYGH